MVKVKVAGVKRNCEGIGEQIGVKGVRVKGSCKRCRGSGRYKGSKCNKQVYRM